MRVMLVDDTRLVRDAIANLLRAKGHQVVAEASNGKEATLKAPEARPDLILMDIRMPIMGGVDATRIIKAQSPNVKIVMLTVSDDEGDLLEAVKNGADGYLLKDLTAEELFAELDVVERGEAVISKPLAGRLLEEFKSLAPRRSEEKGPALGARELEILHLVSQGHSNRDIAAQLFISENTVKYHMKRILDKLHLENRTQVAAWAARNTPNGAHHIP